MIKDYFFIAFNNLKQKGLRSWLTILGIFIGIAAVVSLISLGAGLQAAVMGQFGTLSIDKLTIQNKGTGFGPPGSTVVEKLNDKDVKIIENIPGVDIVITRLIRVVSIEYNKFSTFGYVGDIPNEKEKINLVYDSFDIEIEEGRLLRENDKGKILLGSDAQGDNFEKEIKVGNKIKINKKDFEVIGILKKSSNFQINSVYLIQTNDLEEVLGIEKEYDIIIAQVKDKDEIEEVAEKIKLELRKDRNLEVEEEDFSVETPLQAIESVNTILNIINLIVIGIALISLFVGAVGIANTMYTSVLERTREIGIMKAIGAKNLDILSIFLIESSLLGLVGGIIGALIGLGGAEAISLIANKALGSNLLQISISYPLLFGAIGFSLIIGVISGTLPAIQASKTNVVDALTKW